MMLVDNITFLRQRFPNVREKLKKLDGQPLEQIKIVDTKVGLPTIQVTKENKSIFLHSKYDPMKEAERFIKQFEDVKSYKHILFYGIGLGYHVERFLEIHPEVSFSIYEPSEEVMYAYLETISLKKSIVNKAQFLDVQSSKMDLQLFLNNALGTIDGNVLIVTLPSYENVFKEECTNFYQKFKEFTRIHRNNVLTDFSYEKRWVINSMLNFKYILNTPNILHDVDKKKFKGKPAIMVAAGPSLSEEIENLRYIKENKLAYIFAVGSAINALIKYGIDPDAVCTYDPTEKNKLVFEKINEENINHIPMIFGSSVGFEVLQDYKGPKLHMITTQDTVSPYYLKIEGEDIQGVNDAPSIAAVTLQLLYALDCSPIILIGQNLGFKDNRIYSKGIEYEHLPSTLNSKEEKNIVEIENVEGEIMLTNETFIRIRQQLEHYIQTFPSRIIINSTKGGAKIEGTIFKPLETVMNHLDASIDNDVFEGENKYDINHLKDQHEIMKNSFEEFLLDFENTRLSLKQMEELSRHFSLNKLQNQFDQFDQQFGKLINNHFYKVFVGPTVRVEFNFVQKQVLEIRKETNVIKKSKQVIDAFGKLLYEINQIFPIILSCFNELEKGINDKINQPYKETI